MSPAPLPASTPTPHVASPASRARWTAIATGAGLFALSGPGQTAGFSVFVDPVTEAFGISRSQLTAAYLVATLVAAPVGWWLGRHLDHHRLATMVRFTGGALALALLVTAVSPGLGVLTLGVFGLRAFGQSGLTLTSSVFVARAITERRGAALGWLAAIGGFAISLTPLVASRLIPWIGWRQTWAVLAVVVFAGSWSLASLTTRRSAAIAASTEIANDVGTATRDVSVDVVSREHSDPIPRLDVELGEIDPRRRRWAFAVVASGFATVAGISTALSFHQVAVLGERGLSAAEAATNFLPQSIAAAISAVVVGRTVDRVPGRLVVPAVMSLLVIAVSSLWLVRSPLTAVLFGLLLGTAAAANGASEGALLARWTGLRTLGRLRGRLMAIVVTSTAVAPLLFTLLADATGSFARAATITLVVPVAVAAMALVAPLPRES